MRFTALVLAAALLPLAACQKAEPPATAQTPLEQDTKPATAEPEAPPNETSRFDIYATMRLTADLSQLDERQKQMIPLLIDASKIMDELFWLQAFGEREPFLAGIDDPAARRFAEINYGPWDRLAADQPFMESHGAKPLGAQFYPADMTKEEFEAWEQPGKDGLYTLIRRNEAGELTLVPYSEAYAPQL
jgi:hypothetical protein